MAEQSVTPAATGKARTAKQNQVRALVVEGGLIGATVAGGILKPMMHDDERQLVVNELMAAALEDFKPQSAAERMLVEQLVVTHVQLMRAQRRTGNADAYPHIEVSSRIASRLQDDFRKTLAALRDWNAPPRAVIHAQQANVAHQQVIQQVQATQEGGQ